MGGTICTSINESGHLTVSKEAGILLKDNYLKSDSPYADKVKIDTTKNLYVLSENMTVKKWNEIIKTYRKYVSRKKYDGVILAHGTDTLAYSASIVSILFSASEVPVFFVSANENLKSDKTNGNDNFRCAVECICRGIIPNVYVPYKNISDGRMYIHLGSRLEQCRNYSEDFQVLDIQNAIDQVKSESGVNMIGILGSEFFRKYKYILDFNELVAYSKK